MRPDRLPSVALLVAGFFFGIPAAHADEPVDPPASPPVSPAPKPQKASLQAVQPTAKQAKPARRLKIKRKAKMNRQGPIATFPGFRMLEDGTARVYVEISQKVDISELAAEGRVVYRMKGVYVPTRNNRLPLLTAFFPTSIARVQLVEQDDDADLVIELKQPAKLEYRIVESEGGVVLQVDCPPATAPAPRGFQTEPEKAAVSEPGQSAPEPQKKDTKKPMNLGF
jgi:hypothetical protein